MRPRACRTRPAALALLGGLALLSPGCARDAGDAEPAPAIAAETEIGPVRLRIGADRADLRAADRLLVTATVEWDAGARVGEVGVPAEREGWTVISRERTGPSVADSGRLASATRLVLEPGLPGDYQVPAAQVAWTDADGRSGVAQTEPLAIRVTPLLDEGADLLALAPAREPPPAPPARRLSRDWIVIGAGVLLVPMLAAIVVAAWFIRRAVRTPADPVRQRIELLEATLATPSPDPVLLCDAAAESLRALPPAARTHAAPRDLARRLDSARFAPAPPDPATALDLARRTLDLLRPPRSPEAPA